MGLFNRKKTKKATRSSFGEPLNRLTPEGKLPFGWMRYNKNVIDQIESELSVFRSGIHVAKDLRQRYSALQSYMQYLSDGKKHYYKIGECEGKYFEEYIIDSEETRGNRKELERVKEELIKTRSKAGK